jgi:DNA-binding CsgD family transcriptional regulator
VLVNWRTIRFIVGLLTNHKHTTTMKITTQESQAEQARRLAAKTQDQRMVNEVTSGTGMSPWEAQVVIEVIREVYFATPGNAPLRHGQLLYTCVKTEAGAGVALKECPMTSVTLSLMGDGDDQVHGAEMLRRHRIGRFCEEARDQGGLLTQEDLAQILSCDARTIRRDIKALKQLGIHIPTRGQQKDIGPTLTHKGVAIRHWLEGKEPQEVARAINHSLRAVERYLNHFARIIYCVSHGFSVLQTAFALGISNASVRAYLDIYQEFKDKEGFRIRVAELKAIGEAHHESGDAKKGALLAPEKWINSSQKGASKP